jgi:uncharacterized membrane protein
MAKLTAWLVTLIGLLLLLNIIVPSAFSGVWFGWVVALAVLIVGIGKLMRNYSKPSVAKKRK